MPNNTVENFYDSYVEREWARAERHRMEFATTWRAMQEFIPAQSRILDIGGGPGRYSLQLAEAGHQVTLLDLSAGNVEFARRKADELGLKLEDFVHGDALDLSRFGDASFDVALLMGPLYHLTEEADRRKALGEALRVLKPGGIFIASFITRYAFLVDALKYGRLDAYDANVERFLDNGVSLVSEENPGFTDAYFAHPLEIEPLMISFGLSRLRLAAAEGLIAMAELSVNELGREPFERWVEICYRVGTDPVVWGSAEHMLYVGRKGD